MTKLEELLENIDAIFDEHLDVASIHKNDIVAVCKDYAEWKISQTLEKLSESTDLNMFIKDDSDLMNGGYWSVNRDFIKKFRINDIL